eukprot:718079_1
MGNQLAPTLIPPNVGKQTALIELSGYVLNTELGGGKVLKTMECLDRNNDQVVVKVFYKREENLPLDIYHRKLKDLQKKFSLETHPGLVPFHELVESERVTEAMDIFSTGCAIAEIFLEGETLFDHPQLLRYKDGKFDPTPVVMKIADGNVRKLVMHMIQLDPKNRFSAARYLDEWENAIFPTYFG